MNFAPARLILSATLTLAIALGAPLVAGADEAIPERRIVTVEDMDFYGGDLRSIFDTSLTACQRDCLDDGACAAFTYNTKASACFLKTDVAEMRPFVGAVSAQVIDTPADMLEIAAERSAELAFLPEGDLEDAREMASELGARFPANAYSEADAARAAAAAALKGQARAAIHWRSVALALNDSAENWLALAGLYARDDKGGSRAQQAAGTAAVNSFLRATDLGTRAAALNQIATALEERGYGRKTITALNLSLSLSASPDTEAALKRAISLYGFRIVDHSVDSDAARPRVCVEFSEPLIKGAVDYAPFVRVEGADLPVESVDRQLCIDGVQHGQRYAFTLRAGLPAANGETLLRDADLDVYVRDREPSVRFLGRAYVLPKSGRAAIPVVSVNLDEVALSVHRIGDRNLLPVIQNGVFENPLSTYDENRVGERLGMPVWSGTAEVERRQNADVTTAIPIGEAVRSFEPGVYAMTARVPEQVGGEPSYWERAATQWFIVTDLGLSTALGADGLHVFVRGLSDAAAVPGARVRLIARNNEVLGETQADQAGYANFAPGLTRGPGGSAPALLTVEDAAGDFAFLDLDKPGLDLSDRGVEGRPAAPPVDVFLATERGAYRPGETVHATILARDAEANAVDSLPLTAVVTRPDGVEFARSLLRDQGAGGRAYSLPLGADAQRGTWNLTVRAEEKGPALASQAFLVEDFLPERIDFDLAMPERPIDPAALPQVSVTARYLYGAPGAGLAIEGETVVSVADELSGYPGFSFGLRDEAVAPRLEPLVAGGVTDDAGDATLSLLLPEIASVTRPLEITAQVRLREGSGRPVERTITRPLVPAGPQIGVKPLFNGAVPDGGEAAFEVIAVGPDLGRVNLDAAWSLSRLETSYQWYAVDGRWSYEPVTTRRRVASGDVALTPDQSVRVEAPVKWGRYELKLTARDGAYAATSVDFYAGWYGSAAGSDTPDRLEVGLDKAAYLVGDTARLRLNARSAGTALILVADTRLVDMRTIAVEAGETVVELPVTEAWGPGAYVTATLISPMDRPERRNPARAIGVSWVPVDPGPRKLEAMFEVSDEAAPRAPLTVPLQLTGAVPDETVFATIAAVDLGILNLTGFEPPAPDAWYFGQRKLGVELRDLYGRLIDGMQGNLGRIRSGGDAGQVRLNAPPPTEDLVAFFSGPVRFDGDGRAEVQFDLPDFNGTVRLMAVIWSGKGVGHAVKDVLVRDPVVLQAALPRFLAPGDASRVRVELAHVSGPAGEAVLTASTGSGITLDGAAEHKIALEQDGRVTVLIPATAAAVGDHQVKLDLVTPGGERLTKTLRLPVRVNDPEVVRQNQIALAPDGRLVVDAGTFDGFVAGTGRATLAVGPVAQFDVPGLLTALDRYPYGCTEQTTSRALPLVYLDQVAEAMGLTRRNGVAERVQSAVARVLANQTTSGAFGLWRPAQGDYWLDAYVTDFLSRARQAGHVVPDRAFEAALDNLRNRVSYSGGVEDGGEALAYALMVLAREGIASIGDLRYYADTQAEALSTPLAQAQLAAALASYGEPQRSDSLFRLAVAQIDDQAAKERGRGWRADYGSLARDTAGVLALSAEVRSLAVDRRALTRQLIELTPDWTSTQEKVWTLLAARALIDEAASSPITVDGGTVEGPVIRLFEEAKIRAGGAVTVENGGTTAVDAVLTTFGVPVVPEPAGGNGYRIERGYFTLDGEPVAPDAVAQNTRLVAVLTITEPRARKARLMIDDPLPAGFEIDNPNLIRAGDLSALDWLETSDEVVNAEFRADRFLAAIDRQQSLRQFSVAYVVRAVSPGRFHHPAAIVEDMYRPEFRARTATGAIEVLGPVQ